MGAGMKPIVFSMAFNGYGHVYAPIRKTQEAYAERNGYDYVYVERPGVTPMLRECAWLKVPLIAEILGSGRPWALFLDADAEVKEKAPPVETILEPDHTLYMAEGFSGRLNSGVILARQSPEVIDFLEKITALALEPLPADDDVHWGENGHFIYYGKSFDGLKVIPWLWNNNRDPEAEDYIRHYSGGPMHPYFKPSLRGLLAKKTAQLRLKRDRILRRNPMRNFHTELQGLVDWALEEFPELAATSAQGSADRPGR